MTRLLTLVVVLAAAGCHQETAGVPVKLAPVVHMPAKVPTPPSVKPVQRPVEAKIEAAPSLPDDVAHVGEAWDILQERYRSALPPTTTVPRSAVTGQSKGMPITHLEQWTGKVCGRIKSIKKTGQVIGKPSDDLTVNIVVIEDLRGTSKIDCVVEAVGHSTSLNLLGVGQVVTAAGSHIIRPGAGPRDEEFPRCFRINGLIAP